jgi:hypothetical protein
MLGTKLAGPGAKPPRNLAEAATRMVWACALATARIGVASTARGLELWSHALRAPPEPLPSPPSLAEAERTAPAVPDEANASDPTEAAAPAAPERPAPAEAVAFASYRSAGGHAAAQVTVADSPASISPLAERGPEPAPAKSGSEGRPHGFSSPSLGPDAAPAKDAR